MARTPEKIIKDKVDAILKRHGVWYFKPVSAGYGTHGIPDYVCCVEGWFLGVECKGLDGQLPTVLQHACHDRITSAQGVIFIATPGTLAALEHLIVKMKIRKDQNGSRL